MRKIVVFHNRDDYSAVVEGIETAVQGAGETRLQAVRDLIFKIQDDEDLVELFEANRPTSYTAEYNWWEEEA